MSETLQMILVFIIMILVIIYARRVRAAKMIKARDFILEDLRSKNALSAESAVHLDYAQRSFFRIGLRDDRPKVLRQMIQFGIIGMTEGQLFYLNESALSHIKNQP